MMHFEGLQVRILKNYALRLFQSEQTVEMVTRGFVLKHLIFIVKMSVNVIAFI